MSAGDRQTRGVLLLYITKLASADYTQNNLLILRQLFSAALYIYVKLPIKY